MQRTLLSLIAFVLVFSVMSVDADAARKKRKSKKRIKATSSEVVQPAVPDAESHIAPASISTQQISPAAPTPTTAPVLGERKPRIAIGGLDAKELSDEERAGLEELMSLAVRRMTDMEVISPTDLRAFLNVAQLQQVFGCNDDSCLGELGSWLAVQQLVSGSVRRVGEQYVVSLQRSDLVNHRMIERASEEVPATIDALLAAVPRLVPTLFGVAGRLVIWEQPGEGEVFVDGRLIGETPVDAIILRQTGQHKITIRGPGITTWQESVMVEPGADLRLRALNQRIEKLEAEASSRKGTGMTMLGVGLAGALGAGSLWLLAYRNDQSLDRIDLRELSQAEIDGITGRTFTLTVSAAALSIISGAMSGAGIYSIFVNPAQDVLDENGAGN